MDFELDNDPSKAEYITGLVLTDRGGFINLNHAVPSFDRSNSQRNPDLYGRAYKAAWLSNSYSALYYNITAPFNGSGGLGPLSSVNSFIGKTYSISNSASAPGSGYNSLTIDPEFGDYLVELLGGPTGSRAPSDSGTPTNPFNVTRVPFDAICESYPANPLSKF